MTRLELATSFRGNSRVVLSLSGGLQINHLVKLLMLVQSAQGLGLRVTLDLAQLRSVDREALREIVGWRDYGVQIRRCPEYVQEWFRTEKAAAGSTGPSPGIDSTPTDESWPGTLSATVCRVPACAETLKDERP